MNLSTPKSKNFGHINSFSSSILSSLTSPNFENLFSPTTSQGGSSSCGSFFNEESSTKIENFKTASPPTENYCNKAKNEHTPRVAVAVRCRPPFRSELAKDGSFCSILKFEGEVMDTRNTTSQYDNGLERLHLISNNRHGGTHRTFGFDHVFKTGSSQELVFNTIARPLLEQLMEGINGTLLAYGQTGTGKTYTMGILDVTDRETSGIIPRCFEYIFSYIDENSRNVQYVVKMSFFQIYMEMVQDLLVTASNTILKQDLPVRQNKSNGFFVEGLQEYEIKDFTDAQTLIGIAMRNRILASTNKNFTSSRSHTLLNIKVYSKNFETGRIVESKLVLVDLAGSERLPTSSKDQVRAKEAKYINKSLSALGNVISELSRNKKSKSVSRKSTSKGHVRFRDSKLTKLLESSFNGKGKCSTVVIAAVDAAMENMAETLSTLKFASRCKRVELDWLQPLSCVAPDAQQQKIIYDIEQKYLTREQQLHDSYQHEIKSLQNKVNENRSIKDLSNASRISLATSYGYYALCDIVDQLHPYSLKSHPDIDSFSNVSELVAYTKMLYASIIDRLDCEAFTSTIKIHDAASVIQNFLRKYRLKLKSKDQRRRRRSDTEDEEFSQLDLYEQQQNELCVHKS